MKKKNLIFLEDKWDDKYAATLDEPELLRYRSNLIGSDLRITNYGGGNTSSKIITVDPLTGEKVEVLWIKGSGGDLRSIKRDGFASLYLDKFLSLDKKYRGEKFEDEMVSFYPLCIFNLNPVTSSIETPLHGLIPYKNINHTHPDWGIAIAASANGRQLLKEFNNKFGYNLIWLPWHRPGYHLATKIREAINNNPKAEGIILASHGLVDWADDHYTCYRHTLEIIDSMGEFVASKIKEKGEKIFGGKKYQTLKNNKEVAVQIFPVIKGGIIEDKPAVGHFTDLPEVLKFVNSKDAKAMAFMGTSCPDHFIRTKVRPMYVDWNPQIDDIITLHHAVKEGFIKYAEDYKEYYESNKETGSPAIRGSKPAVILIPGVGMFSFGKNKKEAVITGEFYVNAIHVMEGTTSMDTGEIDDNIEPGRVFNNYVALTPKEAFKIEYWDLEEAKIQRLPKEKEFSGKIVFIAGGGKGIGREFCRKMVSEGAYAAIADMDFKAAEETAFKLHSDYGDETCFAVQVDLSNRLSTIDAFNRTIMQFGGLDILINPAAFMQTDKDNKSNYNETPDKSIEKNAADNRMLTEEFVKIIQKQNSNGTVLLISSAGTVIPKSGFKPNDAGKSSFNNFIRESAIRYSPVIRINGVSTAYITKGSTLLNKEVRAVDIVEAGYYLISEKAGRTTGHIIPVDGGLVGL